MRYRLRMFDVKWLIEKKRKWMAFWEKGSQKAGVRDINDCSRNSDIE